MANWCLCGLSELCFALQVSRLETINNWCESCHNEEEMCQIFSDRLSLFRKIFKLGFQYKKMSHRENPMYFLTSSPLAMHKTKCMSNGLFWDFRCIVVNMLPNLMSEGAGNGTWKQSDFLSSISNRTWSQRKTWLSCTACLCPVFLPSLSISWGWSAPLLPHFFFNHHEVSSCLKGLFLSYFRHSICLKAATWLLGFSVLF